jgi:hypothetical protein
MNDRQNHSEHANEKDISNLNSVGGASGSDLPPKQPKHLNYKKERKTIGGETITQLTVLDQGKEHESDENLYMYTHESGKM